MFNQCDRNRKGFLVVEEFSKIMAMLGCGGGGGKVSRFIENCLDEKIVFKVGSRALKSFSLTLQ